MCHHIEVSEREREELLEEYGIEELRAEHSEEELEELGVTA